MCNQDKTAARHAMLREQLLRESADATRLEAAEAKLRYRQAANSAQGLEDLMFSRVTMTLSSDSLRGLSMSYSDRLREVRTYKQAWYRAQRRYRDAIRELHAACPPLWLQVWRWVTRAAPKP